MIGVTTPIIGVKNEAFIKDGKLYNEVVEIILSRINNLHRNGQGLLDINLKNIQKTVFGMLLKNNMATVTILKDLKDIIGVRILFIDANAFSQLKGFGPLFTNFNDRRPAVNIPLLLNIRDSMKSGAALYDKFTKGRQTKFGWIDTEMINHAINTILHYSKKAVTSHRNLIDPKMQMDDKDFITYTTLLKVVEAEFIGTFTIAQRYKMNKIPIPRDLWLRSPGNSLIDIIYTKTYDTTGNHDGYQPQIIRNSPKQVKIQNQYDKQRAFNMKQLSPLSIISDRPNSESYTFMALRNLLDDIYERDGFRTRQHILSYNRQYDDFEEKDSINAKHANFMKKIYTQWIELFAIKSLYAAKSYY